MTYYRSEPVLKTIAEQTFARLDRISRTRALTTQESQQLQRAIEKIDERANAPAPVVGWSPEIESAFRRHVESGRSIRSSAMLVGKTGSAGVAKWKRMRHA